MADRILPRPRRLQGPAPAFLLDRPYIFVHINKTGGSSVEKCLELPTRHLTARECRDWVGDAVWRQRYTFAFVRNPWDKVVSHYHYRVKTNQTDLADRPLPFPDWVRRVYGEQDPFYLDKPRMFMPQVEWLCDEQGLQLVDFIGRFERLEADFNHARDRLGLAAQLPHVKSSERGNYRDYYDDTSAALVEQAYADDIAAFGYRF